MSEDEMQDADRAGLIVLLPTPHRLTWRERAKITWWRMRWFFLGY